MVIFVLPFLNSDCLRVARCFTHSPINPLDRPGFPQTMHKWARGVSHLLMIFGVCQAALSSHLQDEVVTSEAEDFRSRVVLGFSSSHAASVIQKVAWHGCGTRDQPFPGCTS